MKTTETNVVVEILDNGKRKRHVYPISDRGELMTNRLWRLLNGRLGHSRGDYYGERHEVRFVGMVWQSPYTLLCEIAKDRGELQYELMKLGDHGVLAMMSSAKIPEQGTDEEITALLLRELKLRRALKGRIRELDEIKTRQARGECAKTGRSGVPVETGGGWLQP